MKFTYFLTLVLFSLLGTQFIWAEVYMWTDDEGNTVYSDQAEEGAKIIEVDPVPAYNFPKPPEVDKLQAGAKKLKPFRYKQLNIISPEAEETIWNSPGDVVVAANIAPTLQPQHQLRLLLDGETYGEPGRTLGWGLLNIDRGSHQLQLQVLNENGKVIQSSEIITFYLHRPSVLFPNRKK